MRKSLFLLPLLVAASCVSTPARAGVVYSNLGVGGAVYDCCNGVGVIASGLFGFQFAPAVSFTPTSTAIFSELDIALEFNQALGVGSDRVTVNLTNDASGFPGVVPLEFWNVSGLPATDTCCSLQKLPGTGGTILNAGTTYWVTVFPAVPDTLVQWNTNSRGINGTLVTNNGTGWTAIPPSTGITGAFQVLDPTADPGTLAPEPGTGALGLAAGALALMMVRRTGRQRS